VLNQENLHAWFYLKASSESHFSVCFSLCEEVFALEMTANLVSHLNSAHSWSDNNFYALRAKLLCQSCAKFLAVLCISENLSTLKILVAVSAGSKSEVT